jgi:type VI secretion system secreted protein VgrG
MYNFLVAEPCTVVMSGVDLGGETLTPGVYCFATSAGLTGALTLDAQGDTAAVFIFQMGSTLTVANGSSVAVINGAQGRHVWWQVGSSATLGIGSTTLGNVLASASITLNTNAIVNGRALAQTGAVTMDSNSFVAPNDHGTPTSRSTWGKVKSLYR